jgi:hypothetical protein
MSHDEHHDDEHIHMPDPSWAPVILAFGMALLGFGFIWVSSLGGLIATLLGVLITMIGLGKWIYEDIRKPGVH